MNINKLKEIVENGPEGATHFDGEGFFYKFTGNGGINRFNNDAEWVWDGEFVLTRSLEDIRTIIELYEALNSVSKSHQEPKDHGSWYTECNGCGEDIDRYGHESDCPFKLLERFE